MMILPVISDLQIPLHDKRAVAAVSTFVADLGVDTACVGDVLDQWQVSQWCRGRAGEHDGQLGKARDQAVQIMIDLRIRDLSRSNHDERIEKYVQQHAGGLAGLPELRIENFLHLPENGIRFHRKPYGLAPGWFLMHGDEGSSVRSSGGTALGLGRRVGASVVSGHTHRLGLQHDHASMGGRLLRSIWGFEVGNLMDMGKAGYLKAGIANWQSGFGVLLIDGNHVTPMPIPIVGGKFYFDGKKYKG